MAAADRRRCGRVHVEYPSAATRVRSRPVVAGAALSFGPTTLAAVGYLLLPVTGGGLAAALWIFALAPYAVAVAAALARPPLSVVAFGPPADRAGRTVGPTGPAQLSRRDRRDAPSAGRCPAPRHPRTTASLGIYVVAYQTVEPILILSTAGGATILGLGHGRPEVEGGTVTARLIRETLLVGGAAGDPRRDPQPGPRAARLWAGIRRRRHPARRSWRRESSRSPVAGSPWRTCCDATCSSGRRPSRSR